jgi:hypothetical protein
MQSVQLAAMVVMCNARGQSIHQCLQLAACAGSLYCTAAVAQGLPKQAADVDAANVLTMSDVLLCLSVSQCSCTHPQLYRNRQADPAFQWGPEGAKKPLSLADIIVAGAVVAVQQCSGQALRIPHTYGRPEATAADSEMLPSPDSIIEDKHFSVFQQMVSLQYEQYNRSC